MVPNFISNLNLQRARGQPLYAWSQGVVYMEVLLYCTTFLFHSFRLLLPYLIGGYQTGKWLPSTIIIIILVTHYRADCSSNHSINRSSCNLKLNDRISIYGLLTICVWVSCITRTILFYILALRAARVLHNRLFTTLLRAPVLFFDTNPVG